MRVIPVLLMAVAMVVIGACGNADSKSANSVESELRACVTTLVFMANSHIHEGRPRLPNEFCICFRTIIEGQCC